ncbi:MAG: 3-deoxy-manno-octulosonate cytidylyltransferase [Planctomycetes bacterium]|nr:3-deoxy-manno-octulosonate cytidylyltransferase [Planctomycetota bacterium]
MNIVVVIPARYESTRLPGKVLAKDTGKFLVQHTYERALSASSVSKVIIATDSMEVMKACNTFGAECIMTNKDHQSGTDRIAEAVTNIDADIIINLQADEPEIDPACIDQVGKLLIDNPDAEMATLIAPFEDESQITDPNVVKCITDNNGRAIYFSRSVIPYDRNAGGVGDASLYYRHLGMYAYRRDFLMTITTRKQTALELSEKLEQLRAIEYGYSIMAGVVKHCWEGIDTPAQYKRFVERTLKD